LRSLVVALMCRLLLKALNSSRRLFSIRRAFDHHPVRETRLFDSARPRWQPIGRKRCAVAAVNKRNLSGTVRSGGRGRLPQQLRIGWNLRYDPNRAVRVFAEGEGPQAGIEDGQGAETRTSVPYDSLAGQLYGGGRVKAAPRIYTGDVDSTTG